MHLYVPVEEEKEEESEEEEEGEGPAESERTRLRPKGRWAKLEAELRGLDVRELLVRSVVETAQLRVALAPLLRSVREIVDTKERIDAWEAYAAGGVVPPNPKQYTPDGDWEAEVETLGWGWGPVRRSRGWGRRVKGNRGAEKGWTRKRVRVGEIKDRSENGARCRIEMKFLESETSPKRVRAGVR